MSVYVRMKTGFDMPSVGLALFDKDWFGNKIKGFKWRRLITFVVISLVIYTFKMYTIAKVVISNWDNSNNTWADNKGDMSENSLTLYEMFTYKKRILNDSSSSFCIKLKFR